MKKPPKDTGCTLFITNYSYLMFHNMWACVVMFVLLETIPDTSHWCYKLTAIALGCCVFGNIILCIGYLRAISMGNVWVVETPKEKDKK